MDVTGRTESDPAAGRLVANIFTYLAGWKPAPVRTVLYAGDPAGKTYLQKAGITAGDYNGGELSADQVLVLGPGAARLLAGESAPIAAFLKSHGHLLAIGLDESESNALLPSQVTTKTTEHIACFFQPPGGDSLLAGIAPADVYDRQCPDMPLVTAGATAIDDGVLAKAGDSAVFFQLVPWDLDYARQYNLKMTYRRSSFALMRVLANMGAAGATPILDRFRTPLGPADAEKRWLDGLYLDQPQEWDDPYRFFGW
jgi:hypothetical protein